MVYSETDDRLTGFLLSSLACAAICMIGVTLRALVSHAWLILIWSMPGVVGSGVANRMIGK